MKLRKKQKKVEFLVDTMATYSVLNQALMPLENDYIMVKGVTGQSEKAYFYKLGKQWDIHKFLHSNGKTLKMGVKPSLLRLCYHKDTRTALLYSAIN